MSSLIRKIRQTIFRYALLSGGERILIGVSGGADSLALLHGLWELRQDWQLSLIIAYVDHGLRPEAAEEKAFVHKAADDLTLPFVTGRVDVGALKAEKGLSLQEAAREARYAFLLETARACKADKIALGHTADDQAELVLMRLLRGSGTRGLAGIPAKRDPLLIRPLIDVWRSEVEAFLREKKIPFRDDASNRSFLFLRNRIRHELLPILEKYNPRIRPNLVQMADRFRLEEEFWQNLVQEKFPSVVRREEKGEIYLDIPALMGFPLPLRLRFFRRAVEKILGHLRRLGFSHFLAVENLWRNSGPNKKILLPQGIEVCKSYQVLKFSSEKEETAVFEHTVSGPGIAAIPEIDAEMRFAFQKGVGEEKVKGSLRVALLDGDRIRFPLMIRSLRPGDRFQPLGMDGEKKVKDFFIDRKIPRSERGKIPLLFFQDYLLWVAGLRIDHRFRLRPETRQVLKVELV